MEYRFCTTCKVKWLYQFNAMDDANRCCPQCKCDSFFTMNAGNIGSHIYLEQAGESLDQYKLIEHPAQ